LTEDLDGFAHDLHAYVCAPAEQGHTQAPARAQQASTH
jgi:biopolymer transport protein ExbB